MAQQMNASTNFVARFMIAHAFSASVYAATITTVPIGNPANPADARYPNVAGSVARSFNMGKTEVTNAQYVEFLNAVAAADPYGLYNMSMASDAWGGIVRSGVAG